MSANTNEIDGLVSDVRIVVQAIAKLWDQNIAPWGVAGAAAAVRDRVDVGALRVCLDFLLGEIETPRGAVRAVRAAHRLDRAWPRIVR